MSLDVIVTGVLGRMGREICLLVLEDKGLVLAGCTEIPGHPAIGSDIGGHLGVGEVGTAVGPSVLGLPLDNAVIIDFTSPQSTVSLLGDIENTAARVVIGTTGLGEAQKDEVERSAGKRGIIMSPNMSLGVNLLFYLTKIAARRLGAEFDVEILEAHHRYKKDAPSGTARHLGEIVSDARGVSYAEAVRDGRSGLVGERTAREIGMHAVRGGDIVGDHTVLFAGTGERVELRHLAQSRRTFARGAIVAAMWLAGRPAGLYSMNDVLGL